MWVAVGTAKQDKAGMLEWCAACTSFSQLQWRLTSCVQQSLYTKVNLFADDALLYHLITVAMDYVVLQEAIDWSITNHLNFNVSKCKFMIISRKISPTLLPNQLYLLGDPLQRVEYYKYLGLLNTSWSMHITATCSRSALQVLLWLC